MKNIYISLFVIVLSIISVSVFVVNEPKIYPIPHDGYIDISYWDFSKDGILKLAGSWDFFPNKLLGPVDFKNNAAEVIHNHIIFNKFWNEQNNGEYNNVHYATYRLVVRTSNPNQTISIIIPVIHSAYKMWVNEELVAKAGEVGTSPQQHIPEFYSKTITFTNDRETLDIILQISNFSSPAFGIDDYLKIGSFETTFKQKFIPLFCTGLFTGFVLSLGIYHMILFFLRKKELSSFLLSATCISFSIWYLMYPNFYKYIYKNNYFELLNKIEYLSITILAVSFYSFIVEVFSKDCKKKYYILFCILSAVYSNMILCTDYIIYRRFIYFYDAAIAIGYIHILYISLVAYFHKREGSIYLLIANIIGVFSLIVEMSKILRFSDGIGYSIAALASIMFFESCILALRFKNTFIKSEQLTKQLISMNKVKDDFLSNTSHELRTPINGILGIAEAMLEGSAENLSPKAVKNFEIIAESSKYLSSKINNILDFSKEKVNATTSLINNNNIENIVEQIIKYDTDAFANLITENQLKSFNNNDSNYCGTSNNNEYNFSKNIDCFTYNNINIQMDKNSEKIRILAVDDEDINLYVLKDLLELHEYSVDTASDGFRALEILNTSNYPYDLVILDIMMPQISGYEVCRKIRMQKSLFDLPILLLSAKSQTNDIIKGFDAGANDYLIKPFEKIQLLTRIKNLIILRKSVISVLDLNKEIENTQREIIYTLGEIAEYRSKETGNHIRRVAEYSSLLAVKYGLSCKETKLLKTASTMHDIGKIAICDEILNKPGKLTPEEFEVIKTHSIIGYEMLKNSHLPILKTAATIALEHHEKYNGKGYPLGLKKENINIFARITAISDVFDALANNRVYKKAWEMDKIIELFKQQKGEHFDPELTDIFLKNIDDFIEIKEMYKDPVVEMNTLISK